MIIEVNDNYGQRFKAALEKSGEEEKTVVERMIKNYVYDVLSRKNEDFYALEPFLRLPSDAGKK